MIAIGLALLAGAGGCTSTTYDPLHIWNPALLGFGAQEQAPVVEVAAPVYVAPPPPQSEPVVTPPRKKARRAAARKRAALVKPAVEQSEPAKPLTCHNETGATGRIRYVCS